MPCDALPVSADLFVTPLRDRLTGDGRFVRCWNRLLDGAGAADLRGVLTDRVLLGTPTTTEGSLLAARRFQQRVPVATLRRFFFFADKAKDDNLLDHSADTIIDDVTQWKRAVDLSEQAAALFDGANPFMRDKCLRRDLGCETADDVALRLDLCFTSFERTVHATMGNGGRLFQDLVAPLLAAHLLPADEADVLDYWRGVPVPAVLPRGVSGETLAAAIGAHGLICWALAVWRITTALLVERALDLRPIDDGEPTPQTELHERVGYALHLHRDTHLDMLTAMVYTRCFSDESFVQAALTDGGGQYPHALRILCVEELPRVADVLPLANIWYDSGVRKTRSSMLQAVAHVMACKSLNQKCQMRDLPKLVQDYAVQFENFAQLFKLELHCALLGNLPKAEARPWMAARLRLHATFVYLQPPSMPLRGSSLAVWMDEALYPLMFLLREMIIYAIESDAVLSSIMDNNYNWQQHKRITRICNGDMRRVLTRQATERPSEPFDWSQLQRTVDNRNGNPKKIGVAMKYHDAGLKSIEKMRKGSFERIILKEMTSCHTTHGARMRFDEAQVAADLDAISDVLHLAAWTAAQRGRPVLETCWLQALGLSEMGFDRVRRWIFEYYTYDVSDHGYVNELLELYEERALDYIILRAYLLLHDHYCNQRIFFLPAENVAAQAHALRTRFRIEPLSDTPAALGIHYYCTRCDMWATPLVQPPVVNDRLVLRPTAVPVAAAHQLSEEEEEEEEEDEEEEDGIEDALQTDAWAGGRPTKEADEKERRNRESVQHKIVALMRERRRQRMADSRESKRVRQSTYMSNAIYDPLTDRLSCRRPHKEDSLGEIGTADDNGCAGGHGAACRLPAPGKKRDAEGDGGGLADPEDVEDDEDIMAFLDQLGDSTATLPLDLATMGAGVQRFTEHATSAELLGVGPREASAHVSTEVDASQPRTLIKRVDPVDVYVARYLKRTARLLRIDMLGMWFCTRKGIFGLCDECGALTRVDNNRITNVGVSCLHHVTTDMALDSPIRTTLEQRLWKRMRLHPERYGGAAALRPPPTVALLVQRGVRVQGLMLNVTQGGGMGGMPTTVVVPNRQRRLQPVRDAEGRLVKCFYCRRFNAEHLLLAFDKRVRPCYFPLCDVDHAHAMRALPLRAVPMAQKVVDALARGGGSGALTLQLQPPPPTPPPQTPMV